MMSQNKAVPQTSKNNARHCLNSRGKNDLKRRSKWVYTPVKQASHQLMHPQNLPLVGQRVVKQLPVCPNVLDLLMKSRYAEDGSHNFINYAVCIRVYQAGPIAKRSKEDNHLAVNTGPSPLNIRPRMLDLDDLPEELIPIHHKRIKQQVSLSCYLLFTLCILVTRWTTSCLLDRLTEMNTVHW